MYAFEVLGGLSSSSAGFPSLEGHSLNPLWIPSSFLQRHLSEVTVRICLTLYSCFRLCVCVCVSIQTSCLPLPFVFVFCRHCFYSLPSFKEDTFLYSCTNTLFILFVLVQYVSHSWNSQAGYVFFYCVIIITGLVSPEHWINDVTLFSMLWVTVG